MVLGNFVVPLVLSVGDGSLSVGWFGLDGSAPVGRLHYLAILTLG